MTATLSIIAAIGAHTLAIGKNNSLLWHIPGDLPRFKQITEGHPIIMGSKTFHSIGKPLPKRTNIILTTKKTPPSLEIITAKTIEEALIYARKIDKKEIFIIGGGSIYAQTIKFVQRIYLTLVYDDTDGDVFFPPYSHMNFIEIFREDHFESTPPFSWVTLQKK
jgi:dihydrofolate reductase